MDDGNGPYYNESQLDLIEYGNETVPQSPFFGATNGLFEMTTYYADTTSDLGDTVSGVVQSGGVAGYVYQTAVAHGEEQVNFGEIGQSGGPVLTATYTYFAHWDGAATT